VGREHPGEARALGAFTYGLRSSSILVALLNAALLLVVTGGIAWEAVNRLPRRNPLPVKR